MEYKILSRNRAYLRHVTVEDGGIICFGVTNLVKDAEVYLGHRFRIDAEGLINLLVESDSRGSFNINLLNIVTLTELCPELEEGECVVIRHTEGSCRALVTHMNGKVYTYFLTMSEYRRLLNILSEEV